MVRRPVGTEEDASWVVGGCDDVLMAGEPLGSWGPRCGTEKAEAQQEGEEGWEDEVEADE